LLERCEYEFRTHTQFFTTTTQVIDAVEELVEYLDPTEGKEEAKTRKDEGKNQIKVAKSVP
jgi:hypothetical protein